MKKLLAPVAASLAILLAATACGTDAYDATEIPPKEQPSVAAPAPPATQPDCGNPLMSYTPEGAMPQPLAIRPARTWPRSSSAAG